MCYQSTATKKLTINNRTLPDIVTSSLLKTIHREKKLSTASLAVNSPSILVMFGSWRFAAADNKIGTQQTHTSKRIIAEPRCDQTAEKRQRDWRFQRRGWRSMRSSGELLTPTTLSYLNITLQYCTKHCITTCSLRVETTVTSYTRVYSLRPNVDNSFRT